MKLRIAESSKGSVAPKFNQAPRKRSAKEVLGRAVRASVDLLEGRQMFALTPATPDLIAASDTGPVIGATQVSGTDSDNITREATPTFTGTVQLEAGKTSVQVVLYGKLGTTTKTLGSATVSGAAGSLLNWTIASSSSFTNATWQVFARARDSSAAALTGPSSNLPVSVDNFAPSATANSDRSPVGSWYNGTTGAPKVVFTASDPVGSGGTYASGLYNADTTSVTLGEGANQAVSRTFQDLAGNSTPTSVTGLNVDTIAPSIVYGAPTGTLNAAGTWYRTNVNIPYTGSDATSGFAPGSTPTTSGSLGLTAEGPAVSGSVTLTDVAGNSTTLASTAVKIDKTPPPAPTVVDLITADDSGASNTDNVTNVTTPRIDITAGTDLNGANGSGVAAVTLLDYSNIALTGTPTVLGTTSTVVGGNYRFQVTTPLVDGDHYLVAKSTDVADNASGLSPSLKLTIASASVAPDVSAPTLVTDSGNGTYFSGAATDNITNVTTPTFSGSATAGVTVNLYDGDPAAGGVLLQTTTANGSDDPANSGRKFWTAVVPGAKALSVGVHQIYAKAVNGAGNSTVSAALAVTIDTSAPSPFTGPTLDASTDSGTVGDGRTNIDKPMFSGTVEALSVVEVYLDGSATPVGLATVTGTTWSYTFTSTIADGSHTVAAKAIDRAGNATTSSTAFTIDTLGPDFTEADLVAADDSGADSTDNLTNAHAPTFTGFAESGALVSLYDGVPPDVYGGPLPSGTILLGTASASGTLNEAGLAPWSITTTNDALAPGAHDIYVTASDAATNLSISDKLTVTIDRAAPTVSSADLRSTDDSGTSSSDNLTNALAPNFDGTAETGATVKLYDGNPATSGTLLGTTTSVAGSWTVTVSSGTLTNGTHQIYVVAEDTAGNKATALPLSVTIDRTAPTESAPDLAQSSDSGAVGDHTTSADTPTFRGSAEPGALIKLYRVTYNGSGVETGRVLLGTGVADQDTSPDADVPPAGQKLWRITSTSFTVGTHKVVVVANDAAGNITETAPVAFTFDFTPPTISIPDLDAADDLGSTTTDNITKVTTPQFSGTAEAGSRIDLYDVVYDEDGFEVTRAPLASGTAGAGGTWSIRVPALSDGVHNILATATDAVDLTQDSDSFLAVTIDTVKPTVTFGAAAGTVNAALWYKSDVTVPVTGQDDRSGVASVTPSPLVLHADGSAVTGTVTVVDVAGNSDTFTSPAYKIDQTKPAAPALADLNLASDSGFSGTDNVTNVNLPSFTFSVPVDATSGNKLVTVYDNGTPIGTATKTGTAGATETWTFTATATFADGAHLITIASTDNADNASDLSPALTVNVDTTLPDLAFGTPAGTVNAALWYKSDVSIPFTASDVPANTYASGVRSTQPSNAGSPALSPTGTLVLQADGSAITGTVTVVDAAGNSKTFTSAAFKIDQTAPTAPALGDLDNASDSAPAGYAGTALLSDNVTNDNTPSFTFSVPTDVTSGNKSLAVLDNGVQIGTAVKTGTVGSTETWTFTAATLSDGLHKISVASTDTADNTSAASPELSVTIDTAKPTLAFGSPSGTVNAAGWYKSDVTIPVMPSDPGSGVYSVAPSPLVLHADGNAVTGQVTAVDNAGNTDTFTSPAYKIDQTPPPQTPTAGLDLDDVSDSAPTGVTTGPLKSDNITNVATPDFSFTVPADAAPASSPTAVPSGIKAVEVYDRVGSSSTVAKIGEATFNVTSGKWTFHAGTALVDGTHHISVKSVDAADNSSIASPELDVVIDTVRPVATSQLFKNYGTAGQAPVYPTGSFVAGTGTAADGVVRWFNKADGLPTIVWTAVDSGSDLYNPDYSPVTLGEGANQNNANQLSRFFSDVAGNRQGFQPDNRTGNVSHASPLGIVPGPYNRFYVDVTDPTIAETDRTKHVLVNINTGDVDPTGTATGPGWTDFGWNKGTVSVTFGGTDAVSGVVSATDVQSVSGEGAGQSVTGTITDKAGNASTLTAGGIKIDRTSPTVATYTTDVPSGPADLEGPNLTENADGWWHRPVSVHLEGDDLLSTVAYTTPDTIYDQNGIANVVEGQVVDQAGNVILLDDPIAGPQLILNIDQVAPAKPAAPDLQLGSDTSAPGFVNGGIDNITSDATPTFDLSGLTDTLSNVKTVNVYDTHNSAHTLLGTVTLDGSNNPLSAGFDDTPDTTASFTAPTLGDGVHVITIETVDFAGNTSAVSNSLSVQVDTAAPTINAFRDTNSNANALGWNDADVTVHYDADDEAFGSGVVPTTDTGTHVFTAEGPNAPWPFTVYDVAGNQRQVVTNVASAPGATSNIGAVKIDKSDPTASLLTNVSGDTGSNVLSVLPGETVTLTATTGDAVSGVLSGSEDWSGVGSAAGNGGTFQQSTPGTYAVTFTVSDKAGNVTTASRTIIVSSAVVKSDGFLYVYGNPVKANNIQVATSGAALTVKINGVTQGTTFTATKVVVYGGNQADTINASTLSVPVEVYAGAGNDTVTTGSGNDLVFGEDGNDVLNGGEGNDFLVGGLGADQLAGSGGNDILVGSLFKSSGTYSGGTSSVASEVAYLRSFATTADTNAARLSSAQADFVNDAGATDVITGGLGEDWFITYATDTTVDFTAAVTDGVGYTLKTRDLKTQNA